MRTSKSLRQRRRLARDPPPVSPRKPAQSDARCARHISSNMCLRMCSVFQPPQKYLRRGIPLRRQFRQLCQRHKILAITPKCSHDTISHQLNMHRESHTSPLAPLPPETNLVVLRAGLSQCRANREGNAHAQAAKISTARDYDRATHQPSHSRVPCRSPL